jgi:uncharacterized protein (TIGR03086 family)
MNESTDPRPNFAAACAAVIAIAERVPAEALAHPTPCDGFDVRAVLGHLVGVLERAASVGRGEPAMAVEADGAWVTDDRYVEALHAQTAQVSADWSDDATLERTVVFPWVTQSGADSLRMWTNELVVHGWDVAVAIGETLPIADGSVAAALAMSKQQLPMAERAPMWAAFATQLGAEPGTFVGPFADAVAVPANATLLDQVVAWNGRNPSWARPA